MFGSLTVSDCRSDADLLKLASGRFDPREELLAREHLKSCETCARRYEDLHDTWEVLGEWAVSPPSRDLALVVAAAARRQMRFPEWRVWLRVAASVALAAGIGTAAGLLTPVRPARTAGPVSGDALLRTIGVDALVEPAPILSDVFSGQEPAAEEEQ